MQVHKSLCYVQCLSVVGSLHIKQGDNQPHFHQQKNYDFFQILVLELDW